MTYSQNELMIAAAARELKGARVAFVGVGLPNIVCNLAQRSHSPELELVYEAGVFGARPARLPLSIGDPTIVTGAASAMSMSDAAPVTMVGSPMERGNRAGRAPKTPAS